MNKRRYTIYSIIAAVVGYCIFFYAAIQVGCNLALLKPVVPPPQAVEQVPEPEVGTPPDSNTNQNAVTVKENGNRKNRKPTKPRPMPIGKAEFADGIWMPVRN